MKGITETMTLGKIIDWLEHLPPEDEVVFDFCRASPSSIDSSRGDYAELAYCDKCSHVELYAMTALAGGGYDARNITDSFLRRHGWVAKDGKHFCEDCVGLK